MFRPSDRKSIRLNSSHVRTSYAVFCLKKKKNVDRDPVNVSKRGCRVDRRPPQLAAKEMAALVERLMRRLRFDQVVPLYVLLLRSPLTVSQDGIKELFR